MTFEIGEGLKCTLERLVDTRLLVQANSGGGKSFLLRRLLEQTHGHVQHLVIDPEGEFASLRERFDYIHAAKSGADTAADPRTAALLAERLLELKASAVLDIYELKAHERVRFVRLFLEALVNAPKKLWTPTLVIVDEAHVFCPQTGEAESAGAVKDLATRGRKRGFCCVLATQRLSKLHKDAAAECNNKLIGRTGLDVDMKRAADELGLSGKDDIAELRRLKPGEFFAFGPAFSADGVVRVQVGGVTTTHPKAGGHRKFEAPPPTAAIKKLLPDLADLPAEAEGRERTLAELKADLAGARRELAAVKRATPVETKTVERFALKDGQLARAEKLVERTSAEIVRLADLGARLVADLHDANKQIADAIRQTAAPATTMAVGTPSPAHPPTVSRPPIRKAAATSRAPNRETAGDSPLTGGELRTMIAVAQYPDGVTREQLTILTGYKRSSRDTFLQRLGAKGFVQVNGGGPIYPDQAGIDALGSAYEPLPTGRALYEWWRQRLGGGELAILDALVREGPDRGLTRDQISEATGYKRSSRDTFLQRLAARKLIDTTTGGVRAAVILFD